MQSPHLTALLLIAVVVGVKAASEKAALSKLFSWLPTPFWCYALPMALSAAGILPHSSPLYDIFSKQLLPLCLALMLLDTDLASLVRLGGRATALMLCGSVGIVAGMGIAIAIWGQSLPENAWMGLGGLAGSWTGGSMNMLAVKEALRMPESIFAPIVIVDTVVAYGWMAFLLLGAGRRTAEPAANLLGSSATKPNGRDLILTLLITATIAWLAGFFEAPVWRILLTTTAALLLSLTPVSKLARRAGASNLGQFLLLVLLASMGARVDASAFMQAPAFLAAGVTALAVHAGILLGAGKLLKADRGLIATASQANIGGVVSAPIVGAAYDKSLATMGLLMAILGNAIGTYAGVATAALCRWIQG